MKHIIMAGILCTALFCGHAVMEKQEKLSVMKELSNGINLGNSLDVHDSSASFSEPKEWETYWGNPPITEELLKAVRDRGFLTIRIPVTWGVHQDETGRIDPAWMNRVREVVDWALELEFSVILDAHHEEWVDLTPEGLERSETRLRLLWTQIAQAFSDCGEKLFFEGLNEPRMIGTDEEWTAGTKELRSAVNRLNAAFVETVRASGGNNGTRWLLLQAYGNSGEQEALEDMVLPDDDRLIVSMHCYRPFPFALDTPGTSVWNPQNTEDTEPIDQFMQCIQELFLDKGIPVVISEFGSRDKGNLDERLKWTDYFVESAKKKDIPLIWWDDGNEFRLIDRHHGNWVFDELVDLLLL